MIKKEMVEYIAKLAKMEISEEESSFLSSQLSEIIGYIDKLKEVDTKGIEPMRGLHPSKGLTRSDQVKVSSARGDILKNAPDSSDNFFKIPKVIK
ncbi:MAG: Asp-tRNA(Asn)/Glu-tRNA(Gln) amidotransferase subunit GatC [Candidatus Omnitrophica bacterium]|nr:Asp-tRNA(Asn)/Glu-tRNA(Gln) amidotransferase subunit GatC [Candidatus Omnitrophota bacterium]MCF7892369.1 Asp-tRNA(Asn)/Glu-tRNA(Gln) amidotransferase subunit GatC [Candidatus Omnitrophota bacterium]MCF7896139.1 Asp-tRNA(Asn)/Glu-tRNA(Gln) amidotransferase subunit GatC [Candidatus Omnitrophota bacterium]MCF7917251.1 Asp-tRNA(Asn)/Glu-tRNA(Gln) amidotransferase subunit GatC [Candidatus Omnitrophota bacterium]